ncbi:hypothetical protein QZH41_006842 [Actinostola sp. cb2023]|nr:hypothetical protein QZH41_006842 [Actinostola sp. cb2023]
MLKMTEIKLELLNDVDMLLMVEKGIRGGVSMITKRYAKANNKYMKDYRKDEKSIFIKYLDANNLYGWAMSEPLPTDGFKWMSKDKLRHWYRYPCILEVDLEYPEKLRDLHDEYPLAPEHLTLNKVEKSAAVIVDTIDIASLRQERNELQTCFNELTHQQDRIEDELSNEEDKRAVTSEYDRWDKENQEMFKTLNNTIADLLSSQSDRSSVKSNRTRATSQSYASSSSSRSSISRKAEVTIKAAKLDAELKFLYLESENAAALRKQQDEMEKLRIMKELAIAKAELTAFDQVKREEDDENATPPSDCGGSELLHEYLETQLSVLTPSEVGGVKTPPNGTATSSPGDHQKSSSINESNAKKPTPRENFTPTTPSNNDAISRLADLLSERHGRDNLPRPEPEVFDGNLLRFPLWMKSFETLIENQTTSPSERLYYFGRYTGGEAKEAIGGLLPLNSENAYSKAKKTITQQIRKYLSHL